MSENKILEDFLHSIPYFVEELYNSKRLNSSLGYVLP